jgi:predicted HTH transcriptional regulator
MVTFTDEDIFAKLTNTEDATVERKLQNDKRDWVKTVVAFSNSLADGQPGTLLIGVRDDGRIEEGQAQKTNFAEFQKTVSRVIADIYPPVSPTILSRKKDGLEFLVVIVYGSPNRPHFAGKSYRRDGTQSVDASEEHIEEFIARRSSKFVERVASPGVLYVLSLN